MYAVSVRFLGWAEALLPAQAPQNLKPFASPPFFNNLYLVPVLHVVSKSVPKQSPKPYINLQYEI